jgi:hypothetical protein
LIGLRGGVNTYAYAHNDVLGRTDPSGLLVQGTGWTGQGAYWGRVKQAEATAYTFSFVSGVGATITRYNLTSECKCGKQIEVGITAVGPSAGVGFKLTGTVAPFTISDPWPCPEIESLSGKYAVGAAGLTWGANPINSQFGSQYPGIGGSYGMTVMGDGIAIGGGLEFGRDKSITATVGSATVTSAKVKSCPCGK